MYDFAILHNDCLDITLRRYWLTLDTILYDNRIVLPAHLIELTMDQEDYLEPDPSYYFAIGRLLSFASYLFKLRSTDERFSR